MKRQLFYKFTTIVFLSIFFMGQVFASNIKNDKKNIGKFTFDIQNGNQNETQGASTAILSGANVGQQIGGFVHPYTGNTVNYWAGTIKGTLDGTNTNFYCIDINHHLATGNSNPYTDNGSTPNEITYILNNYYPYVSFPYAGALSTNKKEASAVQAAIWHYADGLDASTIGDISIKNRVIQIIDDVTANAGNVTYPDYFTITPDSQEINEGETANFVISALDTDGNPYANLVINLSATSGVLTVTQVTTDVNGQATFGITQNGANFSTITATAHATIQHGTVFNHVANPNDRQKLVLATPTTATSTAQANVMWKPKNITLGDFVWHDKNVNGIQDSGEPGIANVVVTLYDSNNNLLGSTVTDTNGYYQFTQLGNGTYTVAIAGSNFNTGGVFENSINEKWYATYQNSGNDDEVDSDGGITHSVVVTLNDSNDFSIDFGFFHTCMILEKTGPQSVIAGDVINYNFKITNCGDIVLHGGVSVYDPMINPSGNHQIAHSVVQPGAVWEFQKSFVSSNDSCGYNLVNSAWAIGHPLMPDGTYIENVRDDDNWTVEIHCNPKASLGNRVWYDDNKNGLQDLGEDGVKNVTVKLYNSSNALLATTQTDVDGYYLFENLQPGNYYVEFVLPAGYQFTSQNEGNDSEIDSDADETTGKTALTNLTAGENDLSWDAGIYCKPVNDFDLSIVKTVSNANPNDEEIITYTITVTNNSNNTNGTNIVVSDVLPAGVIFQSASSAAYDTATGIWNIGNLNAGESISLDITVKVDFVAGCGTPIIDLGIAAPYNLFVIKDVYQPHGSDTEGKVAVGRNAVFGGYSIGDKLPPSGGTEDVLIVGRKLTFTSGQVYNGNVVYGKYLDVQQTNLCSDGSIRKEDPVPVDFNQADIDLKSLSAFLATKPINGTTSFQWGTLMLEGTDPVLNVFSVDGNDLSAANNMEIDVPNGSVVLVNINRNSVSWTGGLVVRGTGIGNVIYNFPNAQNIFIRGIDIQGSVLAPKAKVNFASGVINGQMICRYYEGQGQMNNSLFHGSIHGNPQITNCAEIQNFDQIDIDLTNNSSCAEMLVNVNVDPNNGIRGNQWVETGNTGITEMIWSMLQSDNGLMLGTVGGHIYLNNGTSCRVINSDMERSSYIWSLYEKDNCIFAGTEKGLFKFNGSDWSKIKIDGDVRAITALNDTLYAAVWGKGVFCSGDNGTTWKMVNNGLPTSFAVQTLTVANNSLFVGTFDLGVYRLDSENWTKLPIDYPYVWSLTTDADNNIYCGTSGDGAYVSIDNGNNWTKINKGLTNKHIYSVAAYNNDVYVSTWAGGVYKFVTESGTANKTTKANNVQSIPLTGSWTSLGMAGIEVSSITIDSKTKTIYAGTSNGTIFMKKDGITDVENNDEIIPTEFELSQNYPNPFNPSTKIEFSIPKAGLYALRIYNVLGQEVATIVNQEFAPGKYTFNFDASNLSSGIYFYKLMGENVNITKKMMLLK